MKALYTVLLLVCSNAFMTIAWYGHLKFNASHGERPLPLILVILASSRFRPTGWGSPRTGDPFPSFS